MRVVIVSESFLPTVNGVTNSVKKVLEHLRDRGHEATVIVPAAGAPKQFAGFPVHEVPALAYRQFPVGLPNPAVAKLITDFAPDVVHAASPFLLGAQAIAAAGRAGIPSVAIFQTDVAGYARRNHLGAATKFAWRVVQWIHGGADLTLVPSSASMHDLELAGVERLARWGRGVDLVTYHPNNRRSPMVQRLRQRLAPHGETIVGYVGRIAPEKQVERLAVLRGIPGLKLAIVGDGPSLPAAKRALHGHERDVVRLADRRRARRGLRELRRVRAHRHRGDVRPDRAGGARVGRARDRAARGWSDRSRRARGRRVSRSIPPRMTRPPPRRRAAHARRPDAAARGWARQAAERCSAGRGRPWATSCIEHYEGVVAARAVEESLLTRESALLERGPRFD